MHGETVKFKRIVCSQWNRYMAYYF